MGNQPSSTTPPNEDALAVDIDGNQLYLDQFSVKDNQLDLSQREISELTEKIQEFKNAKFLSFSMNNLTALPEEIKLFQSLNILILSYNLFTQVPSAITTMTSIVSLSLSHNDLTEIPNSLFLLTKLKILDVSHNQISTLSSDIYKLEHLQHLDVCHNKLEYLPGHISKLRNLNYIFCEMNPFITELVVEPMEVPTLQETVARWHVRHSLFKDHYNVPEDIKSLIAKAQTCDTCRGPYFDTYCLRFRFYTIDETTFPIGYKMCSPHWNNDRERIFNLFTAPPCTAPRELENVTDLESPTTPNFKKSNSSPFGSPSMIRKAFSPRSSRRGMSSLQSLATTTSMDSLQSDEESSTDSNISNNNIHHHHIINNTPLPPSSLSSTRTMSNGSSTSIALSALFSPRFHRKNKNNPVSSNNVEENQQKKSTNQHSFKSNNSLTALFSPRLQRKPKQNRRPMSGTYSSSSSASSCDSSNLDAATTTTQDYPSQTIRSLQGSLQVTRLDSIQTF